MGLFSFVFDFVYTCGASFTEVDLLWSVLCSVSVPTPIYISPTLTLDMFLCSVLFSFLSNSKCDEFRKAILYQHSRYAKFHICNLGAYSCNLSLMYFISLGILFSSTIIYFFYSSHNFLCCRMCSYLWGAKKFKIQGKRSCVDWNYRYALMLLSNEGWSPHGFYFSHFSCDSVCVYWCHYYCHHMIIWKSWVAFLFQLDYY